jgi:hypothetical protein
LRGAVNQIAAREIEADRTATLHGFVRFLPENGAIWCLTGVS